LERLRDTKLLASLTTPALLEKALAHRMLDEGCLLAPRAATDGPSGQAVMKL
jgi:hypothetical protein